MREEKSQVYDAAAGSFTPSSQWVLDTDGCNLAMVLSVEEVDATHTTSNDITEVFQVLGIEAVRRALLREMRAVISFDGSYVNYRHLAVLCDVMTHRGHLMSITRNGINRIDKGCLSKCSFEETVEILMSAAAFGETDYLKGVTENIMFGQLGNFGTGMCDLVVDEDKLRDTNPNFDPSALMGASMAGLEDLLSPDTAQLVSPDTGTQLQPVPDFAASPFSPTSPLSPRMISSPTHDPLNLGGQFSPIQQSPRSPTSPMSPYSPKALSPVASPIGGVFSPIPTSPTGPYITSPQYSPTSPVYGATSPTPFSPKAAAAAAIISPTYSPTSPLTVSDARSAGAAAAAMGYSPTSPTYSPTSPVLTSPRSPYAPGGAVGISPTSPHFARLTSPDYSPRSPAFSPASPVKIQSPGAYSLTSPNYSPTSPTYSPTEALPGGVPVSPDMVMASPRYDPRTAVQYTSPSYSPTSPTYSPTSPTYSPTSPIGSYSPTSPSAAGPIHHGGQDSPSSPVVDYATQAAGAEPTGMMSRPHFGDTSSPSVESPRAADESRHPQG